MIRAATHDDIGGLLLLAEAMHAESRFARRRFGHDKVAKLFAHLIDDENGLLLIAERDGQILGAFAGYVAEDWFGPDKVAGDFGLFVKADRRGSVFGGALLDAYRKWAQERGVVQPEAGITTGVNLEASSRLYRAMGFEPVGTVFEFKGD